MRNHQGLVAPIVLVVACVACLKSGTGQEADPLYPNELPGYQFHARANWRSLQPLASRPADVTALLGPSQPGGHHFGDRWSLEVHYMAEGGSCGGTPFPSDLVGTVVDVELEPIGRVSLLDVRFPPAFHHVVEMGAHDPVGSWHLYRDDFGLEYRVYDESSDDGTIRVGDLKSIVYGASPKTFATLTGCPEEQAE